MRNTLGALGATLLLGGCAVHPEPLTVEQIALTAEDHNLRVDEEQEPLSGAVTLYEAMSRALKYNLDHHVEKREALLRERQLRLSHYALLPSFVANAGYANRDNFSGGESRRIISERRIDPAPSLVSSTSSEREVSTGDLTLSWNVLDFGLSYIRARQTADRVLIARENRRKVANRILEDVRSAYWRAVSAERLTQRLRRLEHRVVRALAGTRDLVSGNQASPLTALTFERELVEIRREIQRLAGQLGIAKTQLSALMNVKPGTSFRVAIPRQQAPPAFLGLSANAMVDRALRLRAELREVAYEKRINQHEATAAILEMLPSVTADVGPNWNSNAFLFSNDWVSWGARASWNLMKVFSYRDRKAEIGAREDLLDTRALAITMAIMTQVHVSRVRLIHARRKYRTASDFVSVQQRISGQIRASLSAGKVSEQTAIREEMNTLVARVKLDLAYVELQNAYANAHASMGVDPFDNLMTPDASVDELAGNLRRGWRSLGDRHAFRGGPWHTKTRSEQRS